MLLNSGEFNFCKSSCESLSTVGSLETISFKNRSTKWHIFSVGYLTQLLIALVPNLDLCIFGSNLRVPNLFRLSAFKLFNNFLQCDCFHIDHKDLYWRFQL